MKQPSFPSFWTQVGSSPCSPCQCFQLCRRRPLTESRRLSLSLEKSLPKPGIATQCSTGVLDEKAAAVAALGTYAEELGGTFAPHIEAVLPALLNLTTYFHEVVRCAAFDAVPALIGATLAAFPTSSAGMAVSIVSCTAHHLCKVLYLRRVLQSRGRTRLHSQHPQQAGMTCV